MIYFFAEAALKSRPRSLDCAAEFEAFNGNWRELLGRCMTSIGAYPCTRQAGHLLPHVSGSEGQIWARWTSPEEDEERGYAQKSNKDNTEISQESITRFARDSIYGAFWCDPAADYRDNAGQSANRMRRVIDEVRILASTVSLTLRWWNG